MKFTAFFHKLLCGSNLKKIDGERYSERPFGCDHSMMMTVQGLGTSPSKEEIEFFQKLEMKEFMWALREEDPTEENNQVIPNNLGQKTYLEDGEKFLDLVKLDTPRVDDDLDLPRITERVNERQDACVTLSEKLEKERHRWTGIESDWISLTAKKLEIKAESENQCHKELDGALREVVFGHSRTVQQNIELQEKYIYLVVKHSAIVKGTAEYIEAGISRIRVKRVKGSEYFKKDTEAVRTVRELLVSPVREAECSTSFPEKSLLNNFKLEFILGVVNGEIIASNRRRADMLFEMQKKGFTSGQDVENSESVGAVWIRDSADVELCEDKLNSKVEKVRRATPNSLWVQELDVLEKELHLDKSDAQADESRKREKFQITTNCITSGVSEKENVKGLVREEDDDKNGTDYLSIQGFETLALQKASLLFESIRVKGLYLIVVADKNKSRRKYLDMELYVMRLERVKGRGFSKKTNKSLEVQLRVTVEVFLASGELLIWRREVGYSFLVPKLDNIDAQDDDEARKKAIGQAATNFFSAMIARKAPICVEGDNLNKKVKELRKKVTLII